jgi:glycogen synthase
MSKRVCFVAPGHLDDPPTGPARQSREAAWALAQLGHDVHVVQRAKLARDPERADGVWWHTVAVTDRWLPGLEHFGARDELYAAATKHDAVLALHRRDPFDLVTVAAMHGEGLLCALDPRLPTVVRAMTLSRWVGEFETWLEREDRTTALAALEHETVAGAPRLHVATHALARDLEIPATANMCVVALGTRDRARDAVVAPGAAATLELLFVGRLERRKGTGVLLQAVASLIADGADVRLTLVGPDIARGADGQTYRSVFERTSSHAAERVRFVGELPDDELWTRFAAADVVCVPSRYESFGNVIIEALMFGRPVVTCPVGGIPEVASDGIDALLVAPDDPQALADALARLVADRELVARMGVAARASYLERFDVLHTAPRTLEACLALPAPTGDETLAERLTAVLARITDLPSGEARVLANQLLEFTTVDVDHAERLRELWYLPAEEFADGVYGALIGRPAAPWQRDAWLAQLRAGVDRRELVAEVLASDEVAHRGVTAEVLADLDRRLAIDAMSSDG